MLFEVIAGIRATTAPGFQLGLRLSPERFDIRMSESLALAEQVMAGGQLDYLDMSLWDCFKPPQDPAYAQQSLIVHFAALPRHGTRLGVAGKIMDAATAQRCLDAGADTVLRKPGKGAFHATGLDALLHAKGISHLLIGGVTTEVCVQTTMREANDRGFECLLLSDCTAATDRGNHDAALKMVTMQGGVFGAVADSAAVIATLQGF